MIVLHEAKVQVNAGYVLSIIKVIPVEKFPALSYPVIIRTPSPVIVKEDPVYPIPFNTNPEKAIVSDQMIVLLVV
ncbi:TPA: hypothetical protein DCZ39_06840 [Patescibacteria group bacterium]|nr:hypothetical protein [Candidatus Gracilibacteria bacterium]